MVFIKIVKSIKQPLNLNSDVGPSASFPSIVIKVKPETKTNKTPFSWCFMWYFLGHLATFDLKKLAVAGPTPHVLKHV